MSIKKLLLIVVWFTFILVGPQYGLAQIQDVRIVDQDRSVKVKIKNDVNVANKLSVEVDPVEPFQWESLPAAIPVGDSTGSISYLVPSGKRLVIESVSLEAGVSNGAIVGFDVSTTVGGETVRHRLVPIALGPAGGFAESYRVFQSLRLYADPDTQVLLLAQRTGTTLAGGFSGTLSGYFVPLP